MSVRCITLYGVADRQEERQQALLLCRRKCAASTASPASYSKPIWASAEKVGRLAEGPHRAGTRIGDHARFRSCLVRCGWPRSIPASGVLEIAVASATLQPLAGPLYACWPPFTAFVSPDPRPKLPTGTDVPFCTRCGTFRRSASLRRLSGMSLTRSKPKESFRTTTGTGPMRLLAFGKRKQLREPPPAGL